MYTVAGMTDKNKDVLLKDLLDLVGSSSNTFLQGLFPDRVDPDSKKRPPTAGDKIKVRPFCTLRLFLSLGRTDVVACAVVFCQCSS
jgi:myosin heavy subunit